VAGRIVAQVRASDTVARVGGDEFVVLLRNVNAVDDALHVAEKIRLTLNEPFALEGLNLEISSCTGVAIYPTHGADAVSLTRAADLAMYAAKESGRNAVRLYQPRAPAVTPA
jgi:diguanylate cyclase (GGDEF)-like protein